MLEDYAFVGSQCIVNILSVVATYPTCRPQRTRKTRALRQVIEEEEDDDGGFNI